MTKFPSYLHEYHEVKKLLSALEERRHKRSHVIEHSGGIKVED